MKTIVLSLALALASAAFADEYTPVDWIQVTEGGGFEAKIGLFTNILGPEGCVSFQGTTINGVTYYIFGFKWVMRKGEGSEWVDMPGTEPLEQLCGLVRFNGTMPAVSGEYRPVGEIHMGEEIGKYTSGNMLVVDSSGNTRVVAGDGNTLIVASDPEAAAEDETADDYEVVDWLNALEGGRVSLSLSNLFLSIGPERCGEELSLRASGESVNVVFSWQVLRNGEWKQVPGTAESNRICGLAANGVAPEPGSYRAAMTLTGGVSLKVASNTIRIGEAEEPETTAVETVSWGFLKSRAAP